MAPRSSLYLISALVLVLGLAAASAIYISSEGGPESSMVDDFRGSKKYMHDLELYGGKANVIADGIFRWFEGLLHGENLSYTVAAITAVISLGFFIAARNTPERKR